LAVEVILDDGLVAAGHEDEVLDAGLAGLVHHVLDHEAGDGQDGFADGGHDLGRSTGMVGQRSGEA
jgi:hypothetical protein